MSRENTDQNVIIKDEACNTAEEESTSQQEPKRENPNDFQKQLLNIIPPYIPQLLQLLQQASNNKESELKEKARTAGMWYIYTSIILLMILIFFGFLIVYGESDLVKKLADAGLYAMSGIVAGIFIGKSK